MIQDTAENEEENPEPRLEQPTPSDYDDGILLHFTLLSPGAYY